MHNTNGISKIQVPKSKSISRGDSEENRLIAYYKARFHELQFIIT